MVLRLFCCRALQPPSGFDDLPRPRDLDTMSEPAFAETVRHIRGLFGIGAKDRPHVD